MTRKRLASEDMHVGDQVISKSLTLLVRLTAGWLVLYNADIAPMTPVFFVSHEHMDNAMSELSDTQGEHHADRV